MAAREVDTFVTGLSTQLPVTGGIVKRWPYEIHHKANSAPKEMVTAAA